jgi:muramoyltetrapeptide carboxypeptidase
MQKPDTIKPAALKPGGTIGLIAPSGAPRDPEAIDRAVAYLNNRGYEVRVFPHARNRYGYLAGRDQDRLADLHAAFADSTVDAVLCIRGGYGTTRIIEQIDLDLIRDNPKIFCGFSDITALGMIFWQKCGLVNFNGPMAASTFSLEPVSSFCEESFWRTVTSTSPPGSIWQGRSDRDYRVVCEGTATGPLVGGNLSLVAAAAGTDYALDARGAIVILEDVDERAYRMDRMLTQLLSSGAFDGAVGVVFGRNVPDPSEREREATAIAAGLPRQTTGFPPEPNWDREPLLDEVIHDRLSSLGIPVMLGLPFGHIDHYATLPIGARATMDTASGELEIIEPAVV